MMTGMAGEMCADSSGAPSEPPLLLPSVSAQPGSQPLPFGSRQVLGEQVGPGSPRKIWTGDSMFSRLQLEGKQRQNLRGRESERTSCTRRGKLWPHTGQRAEASSPGNPVPADAHPGARPQRREKEGGPLGAAGYW